MIGRRRFLALLGIGTASAPLAAKAAADQEIASLTTLRGHGAGLLATSLDDVPHGAIHSSHDAYASGRVRMGEWVRFFGKLPAHIEKNVHSQAKYVQALDPDIACKRSWSMSVKIQEQRARNYAQIVENYRNAGLYETAQKRFKETFGFGWDW